MCGMVSRDYWLITSSPSENCGNTYEVAPFSHTMWNLNDANATTLEPRQCVVWYLEITDYYQFSFRECVKIRMRSHTFSRTMWNLLVNHVNQQLVWYGILRLPINYQFSQLRECYDHHHLHVRNYIPSNQQVQCAVWYLETTDDYQLFQLLECHDQHLHVRNYIPSNQLLELTSNYTSLSQPRTHLYAHIKRLIFHIRSNPNFEVRSAAKIWVDRIFPSSFRKHWKFWFELVIEPINA